MIFIIELMDSTRLSLVNFQKKAGIHYEIRQHPGTIEDH